MSRETLYRQAEDARLGCRYDQARDLYLQSLELGLETAACHLGLGHVLRMKGEFDRALDHYDRAMENSTDETFIMDARLGKALALRALSRHEEAIPILTALRNRYHAMKDGEGEAYTLWALGGASRLSGDFAEGLRLLEQAHAIYKACEDLSGQIYTHCALGGLNRMRGDYDASLHHYSNASTMAYDSGDLFACAYSHCGLGNVARMRGRWEEAMRHFTEAEESYAPLGDRISYAYTVWSMATVHKACGRVDEALARIRECSDYFTASGDKRGLVYAALTLAEIHRDPNRLIPARAVCREKNLPWEGLLVETVDHLLAGKEPAALEERFAAFDTRWRPTPFPLNIP